MSDVYDEWTVATLKDELRERSLPVSGNKTALVQRLIDHDKKHPQEEKIEFECSACDSILRVSAKHTGKVKCPNCGEIQRISEKNEFAERVQDLGKQIQESTQNIGRNHLAVGLSIAGVVLLLISIIIFFSAVSVGCPVEYQGTEIENGQEYSTCTDANGNEMWVGKDSFESTIGKIGLACGALLPLSVVLTASGLFIRKEQVQIENDVSNDTNQNYTKTANIVDSNAMKIMQITSLGIVSGVGIIGTIIFVLILIVLLLFIIFLFYLLLSGGSGF